MSKIRSAIIIPDLQIPHHDKRSLAAVEKYMAEHRFDYYVNLGDFLDLGGLSKFTKNIAAKLAVEDVSSDFAEGRKVIQRHARILRKKNPKVEMVLIEGN